jgi:hypothetical protein
MTIDLTGGFDASLERPFAECPAPGVRDAAIMYFTDGRGRFSLPRFLVECEAPGLADSQPLLPGAEVEWERPLVQTIVAMPDGRVFRLRDLFDKHPTDGVDGAPSVLGAGPLAFRCVEPFRRWTASFRGSGVETSVADLIAERSGGRVVDLEFSIDATMASPPWSQGTLVPQTEAYNHPGEKPYEQLFRATGRLRLGDEEYEFDGCGLRIRRQGIRKASGSFNGGRGYTWQSALFPSGRAFGFDVNPPRPDGVPPFNDGFVFLGDGSLIPARVVEAPFLRRLRPTGDDVSFVLESELGRTTIEGETVASTFGFSPHGSGFALQMGGVRYRWDGEEAYGMIERASPRELVGT